MCLKGKHKGNTKKHKETQLSATTTSAILFSSSYKKLHTWKHIFSRSNLLLDREEIYACRNFGI